MATAMAWITPAIPTRGPHAEGVGGAAKIAKVTVPETKRVTTRRTRRPMQLKRRGAGICYFGVRVSTRQPRSAYQPSIARMLNTLSSPPACLTAPVKKRLTTSTIGTTGAT